MNTELETINTATRVKPPMPGTKRKIREPEPANEPMPQKVGRGRPRLNKVVVPKEKHVRNEAYYVEGVFNTKRYAEVNKEIIRLRTGKMILCPCSQWIRSDMMTPHKKSSKHVKLIKMLDNI